MRRFHSLFLVSLILAAGVQALPSLAADEPTAIIAFDSEEWTISNGRIVDHLGRQALAGSASLRDVDFTDGVIEVDMAMDGRRGFPGIIFRAGSEGDTEVFYVRPHRSKNYSHALQYTPRFSGVTGWQLYSGPGFTTGADIPLDRWVHVRLEIKGTRARIFFDDSETPSLIVGDLKRGTAGGFIGVSGPPNGSVHFSNFRFSTDEVIDFGPTPIRAISRASLTDWEVSQPIQPQKINRDLSPQAQDLGEIEWQRVTADPSGLVDVARFLDNQPQLPGCVVARTSITTERAERQKLLFGYSDEISVFLNTELLFRGDSTFRVRDSEFMGVVGLNDAVVLDLNKGENELLFVVTESFGGWGFMARTESLRADPISLASGVTKSWELTDGLVMSESAAWDPKRNQFYVSNINPPGPETAAEEGFISLIDPSGDVLDLKWVTGLRSPTGIAVLGDRLYVVERTGVAVIDLEKGEIIDRRVIEFEVGFLNDIAVNRDDNLYVSDSRFGAIYRVNADETTLWVKSAAVAGVNGLVIRGDRLFATTMGSESLVAIKLETGEVESIVDLRPFGGDGIVAYGDGGFLVSDFNGLLLRVTLTGEREVIIDTRDAGISLTDFGYAPDHKLVVIPTLRGNSLRAFKLN